MAHILLLEDDNDMLMALSETLQLEDHVVIEMHNGQEALDYLAQEGGLPDLVISDINMPTMDGLEFLRILRRAPAWSRIKVIIMSGASDDEIPAQQAGADAFIIKPFTHDTLEVTVTKLLAH